MESAVLEGLERSYERKSAHERLGVSEKLLMGNVAWTSLFAGKPAPTMTELIASFAYGTGPLWERACPRRGH